MNTLARRIAPLAATILVAPLLNVGVAAAQVSEDDCDDLTSVSRDVAELCRSLLNTVDETLPQLVLLPGVGVEGASGGLGDATFRAALVPPLEHGDEVVFEVELIGDTATEGLDYLPGDTTVTFEPGGDRVEDFFVEVVDDGDGLDDGELPVETFTVKLTTDDLESDPLVEETTGIIVDNDTDHEDVVNQVPRQVIVAPDVAPEPAQNEETRTFTAIMVPPPLDESFTYDINVTTNPALGYLAATEGDDFELLDSQVIFEEDDSDPGAVQEFEVNVLQDDNQEESIVELFTLELVNPDQELPSTPAIGAIIDVAGDPIDDEVTRADENDDKDENGENSDLLPNAIDEDEEEDGGVIDLDKDPENGELDVIDNLDRDESDGIPDELWDRFLGDLLDSNGNGRFDDDCDLVVPSRGGATDEGCDLDADQDGSDLAGVPDAKDIVTIAFRAFDFAVDSLPDDDVRELVMGNVYRAILVPLFDDDGDGDVDADDLDREGEPGTINADDILAVVNETAALIQDGLTPEVSVSGPDGPVDEGNSGTTNAVFTVSLSAPSLLPVKVDVATQDGSAEAGGEYSDYDPVPDPETVTFDPLETEKTVIVEIQGDDYPESDENFELVISNARTVDLPDPPGGTVPPDGTSLPIGPDGEDAEEVTIEDDDGPAPVLTVSDVTVGEPEEGGEGSATVTVEVTGIAEGEPTQNIMADVTTAEVPNEATEGDDYEPIEPEDPVTLTFAPGETTKEVAITVKGDGLDERNETFEVTLTNTRNAVVSGGSSGTGTVTIIDSDAEPVVSVGDAEDVGEDDGDPAVLSFPVTLSKKSGRDVRVDFRTTADADTATPGDDYAETSGTLTISVGDAVEEGEPVSIEVPVVDDDIYEHPQTVVLELDGATNATLGTTQATGTIVDDEVEPELSLSGPALPVTEGNEGATTDVAFTVARAFGGATGTEVPSVVEVSTIDGGAAAGSDYVGLDAVPFEMPAGTSTEGTFTVTVNGDDLDEENETFEVELSNPVDATIEEGEGTVELTIADDDDPPTLSIDDTDVEVGEGDSSATVDVTLNQPSGRTVSVDVSTDDVSAEAGADYRSHTETLTFAPGETTKPVAVEVFGDTLDEPVETFEVRLSNATTGEDDEDVDINDGIGVVTIVDDDDPPTLTIDDADPMDGEGDEGTTPVTFDVHLSQASGKQVTVDVATADGGATAPVDYEAIDPPETLTFAPGETTQQVTVNVVGDEHAEGDEQFTVELSNPDNAGIDDDNDNDSATVTIPNDDGPRPKLSVEDVEVEEADGTASVTVALVEKDGNVTQEVSVDVSTVDGTAEAGSDYVTNSEPKEFTVEGPRTKTFEVTLEQDDLYEPGEPETFEVRLSNASNAAIEKGTATVSLIDSDDPPTLSVLDAAVTEGDSGTKTALVPVTLDGESTADVQVDFATANGSATVGEDYETVQGTITLPPGDNGGTTIAIPIVGDTFDEADETFSLVLSDPVDATIGDGTAVVTIRDDDPLPALSVSDVSVTEGDSGTTTAEFTVSLAPASRRTVTASASTGPGSATAGDDYASTRGKITFEPGATSVVVPVTVGGDTTHERDETFRLGLSSPANARIADPTGVATIRDDDEPPPQVEGVTVEQAPVNSQSTPDGRGYWIATDEGDVFGFGNAERFGSLRGAVATADIGAPVVELTATAEGDGYWLLDDQGGVFTFGDAPFFGSLPGRVQQGIAGPAEVTDMARTPSGEGYVILDQVGGVHTFGDAEYHGSIPGLRADGQSIGRTRFVSIAVTPDGGGYWMLDDNGGVFTFGNAEYFDSIPGLRAAGVPIGQTTFVSLAPTADGRGYWIVDRDGGVFTFGNAEFQGSIPGLKRDGHNIGNATTAAIEAAPGGDGYWIFDQVGGVFTFGSARFAGSVPGLGRS